MKIIFSLLVVTVLSPLAFAQDIVLPAPQKSGGKPLMNALAERQSTKQFGADRDIDQQTLSDLLWAANGFNREDKRTVPSASNKQNIDVYVFLRNGVYLYDAKNHTLILKVTGDHRKTSGTQDFVATVPVSLILVADLEKLPDREASNVNCGFIGQNVYLFCASANLGAVFRSGIDKKALAELLKLPPTQEALYNQCIGHIPTP